MEKGNTAVAADMVAAFCKGELFEISTKKDYPFLYGICTEIANQELGVNSRPEFVETVDISPYNTVILGYPNWWGTMPMPVWTFLEGQRFAGKTILPFCTQEGSAMGRSEGDIADLVPEATLLEGLAVSGSRVNGAQDTVEEWLYGLGLE